MTRTITKGRLLLISLALTLGILALAACGSGATPSGGTVLAGEQQKSSTDLAALLRSEIGSAAYQQLIQGSVGSTSSTVSGIWVTGRGEASADPDLATLNLGVEAFAGTVAEARNEAAVAMGQVIQALKAEGIAEQDIQTRFFNISARYTFREVTTCTPSGETGEPKPEPRSLEELESEPEPLTEIFVVEEGGGRHGSVEISSGSLASGQDCVVERERVILGYDVNNQLTVKVRDLGAVGEVIDEATEAGGDLIRFQGVSFSIEDTEALQGEARAAAAEVLLAKPPRLLISPECNWVGWSTSPKLASPAGHRWWLRNGCLLPPPRPRLFKLDS